jgi:hypothetical protein
VLLSGWLNRPVSRKGDLGGTEPSTLGDGMGVESLSDEGVLGEGLRAQTIHLFMSPIT